ILKLRSPAVCSGFSYPLSITTQPLRGEGWGEELSCEREYFFRSPGKKSGGLKARWQSNHKKSFTP
ncbi:MAG: hypothetical protein JW724_01315, partial [Candidatus Altiarchaeota archaeon]|nr:hypothetical protein [Candidatus Altiarchaeota archaeon]